MKIQLSNKVKKRLSGLTALTLSAAILLSGTFAWQSISQKAKNEASGIANPGGRLHDYFDGQNKMVFVENFTSEADNGVPIFARIRLYEYMEIGKDAGKANVADRNVQVVGGLDKAKIATPEDWIVHTPEGNITGGQAQTHQPMHNYWKWEMGGKGKHMPTFNKDKDSLDADINGTFAGKDGKTGPGDDGTDDKYSDYVDYTKPENNSKTETEKYADGKTSDTQIAHTVKDTLDATVITMKEWLALDDAKKIGPMWVYDTDGWAYWAQPIEPGTATGYLLKGITPNKEPDEEWYYAINVVGQFATGGDWGTNDKNDANKTGFFKDGVTDDALNLLNKVADKLTKVAYMGVKGGSTQYVAVGDSLTLEVDMVLENPTGTEADTYVEWSCAEANGALVGNVFTPTDDMVNKIFNIKATSNLPDSNGLNTTTTADVKVIVMPKEAAGGNGVVEGALDKKKYINYGDNTYKEVKEDGSLGDWRCAGKDKIIGNADDRSNVVVLDAGKTTKFGSKFLGPISTGHGQYYLAMGTDNMLGTDDDIKVVSNSTFPEDLTSILATHIEITIPTEIQADNKVKPGYSYHFEYKVMNNDKDSVIQDITWSIKNTGILEDPDNTKITKDGYLYIGGNEKVGNVITIVAEAKNLNGDPVVAEKEFTVRDWEESDLKTVSPGTRTTVTIDNVEFYLMARRGNEVLLWAKQPYGNKISTDENKGRYKNSQLQQSCIQFLDEHVTIKNKAIATTIYDVYHGPTDSMTGEKVETIPSQQAFPLTYYDLDATKKDGTVQDYTFNNGPLLTADNPVKNEIKLGGGNTLTRSSGVYTYYNGKATTVSLYSTSGKCDFYGEREAVRPALWYRLD